MNKKILFVIISLLIIWSCETEEESDIPITVDEIIGTWMVDAEHDIQITTNTDISILDINSYGTGEITVSGAHSESLKYMNLVQNFYYSSSLFITVQNQPFNQNSLPLYEYGIFSTSEYNYSFFDVEIDTNFDSNEYYGSPTFTLDEFTLTLVDTLTSDSNSVVISGTLTGASIDIPANSPTSISSIFQFDDDETETMTFNEDGTFIDIMTWEDEEDTSSGTWGFDGSVFNITFIDSSDTFSYDFTSVNLSSGALTLGGTFNFCDYIEEDIEDEACFEFMALFSYPLDVADIDAITLNLTITLSQNGTARTSNTGLFHMKTTIEEQINRYRHKLERLREIN